MNEGQTYRVRFEAEYDIEMDGAYGPSRAFVTYYRPARERSDNLSQALPEPVGRWERCGRR